jgi:hypothetical protein
MAELFEALRKLQSSVEELVGVGEINFGATITRLGAIEGKICDSAELASSRGVLKPIQSFSGKDSEDVNECVKPLLQLADLQRWNNERRFTALPLYLTNDAAL